MIKILKSIGSLIGIVIILIITLTVLKFVNNSAPYDATYIISGKSFTLKDGISKEPVAPGSSSFLITKVFGNEIVLDLDGDGRDDKVFFITQEGGGSGTFFYIVARLEKGSKILGSEAVFIGDRIAPQPISLVDNKYGGKLIAVNYADRNPGEPFSTPPSLGKTIYLKFNPEDLTFGQVDVDFPGESNL
jgi:hypothetical protein